jgi:hypothetical protein
VVLLEARLLACAAVVDMLLVGSVDVELLLEACALIRALPPSNEKEQKARDVLEFNCCRAMLPRFDWGRPDYGYHVDRAVELASGLADSMNATEKAGFGLIVQFSGLTLGGWNRNGAGNHVKSGAVSKSARAALRGCQLVAQASDQLSEDDPLQVIFDSVLSNSYWVSYLFIHSHISYLKT